MADAAVCSPTSALKPQNGGKMQKLSSPNVNGTHRESVPVKKNGDSGSGSSCYSPFSPIESETAPQQQASNNNSSEQYQQYHEEGMLMPVDWFPNPVQLYEQEFFSQTRKNLTASDSASEPSRLEQSLLSLAPAINSPSEYSLSPALLKPRSRSSLRRGSSSVAKSLTSELLGFPPLESADNSEEKANQKGSAENKRGGKLSTATPSKATPPVIGESESKKGEANKENVIANIDGISSKQDSDSQTCQDETDDEDECMVRE